MEAIGDEDLRLLANCLGGDVDRFEQVRRQCTSGLPSSDPTAAAIARFIQTRADSTEIDRILHQLRGATIVHSGDVALAQQLCLTMPAWLHSSSFAATIATTEVAMVNVLLHAKRSLRLAFPFIDNGSAHVLMQLGYAWRRGCSVQILCRDHSLLDTLGLEHEFIQALRQCRNGAACRVPTSNGNVKWTFHAKVMIADEITAYVGSANLTRASLTDQAEVGILTSDATILRDLRTWFTSLWAAMLPSE
jgi:phosphatidylserine/phosphatidylglycerophosphate/cardiolipin synthase-like enzyme